MLGGSGRREGEAAHCCCGKVLIGIGSGMGVAWGEKGCVLGSFGSEGGRQEHVDDVGRC